MKKICLLMAVFLTLSMFTACQKQEPQPLEPFVSSVEDVNSMIEALGEVTDIESAAMVVKIYEEYSFLTLPEQEKVTNYQKVLDSIEAATEFLDKEAMTLKVMSFNVLCSDLTEDRMQRVIEQIRSESPDVVGMQEGTDLMCMRIVDALGDEYAMLGHGREAKSDGENNNILYKKDAFRLIETQTLWITDTPEVYSRHPESACYRIFTYQLLERKSDGQVFLHVNTHFDHIGANARVEQSKILTAWIEENFKNKYPVVITGDFNCGEETVEYQTIISADYRATTPYGESKRTYQGCIDDWSGTIIDFCFVNDYLPIVSYKVCPEKMDGEWISDHNAIVSEVLLIPTYNSIEIPQE